MFTKISDKMAYANSVAPDQTAPSSTMLAIPLSNLRNNCIKADVHRAKKIKTDSLKRPLLDSPKIGLNPCHAI